MIETGGCVPHQTGKFASTVEPPASLAVTSTCWRPRRVPQRTSEVKPPAWPAIERQPLGRAAVVGDEHLGIAEPRVDDRVDRERAAGRERARDRRRRHARSLQREHHGARPVVEPLDRPDADPRGRAVREDLREPRPELVDDQLRRVEVAPHHEQVAATAR